MSQQLKRCVDYHVINLHSIHFCCHRSDTCSNFVLLDTFHEWIMTVAFISAFLSTGAHCKCNPSLPTTNFLLRAFLEFQTNKDFKEFSALHQRDPDFRGSLLCPSIFISDFSTVPHNVTFTIIFGKHPVKCLHLRPRTPFFHCPLPWQTFSSPLRKSIDGGLQCPLEKPLLGLCGRQVLADLGGGIPSVRLSAPSYRPLLDCWAVGSGGLLHELAILPAVLCQRRIPPPPPVNVASSRLYRDLARYDMCHLLMTPRMMSLTGDVAQ